jgi:hypothetical protein
MYGSILMINSIWYCGARDMQLQEMEQPGFFLNEHLVRREFPSGIFRFSHAFEHVEISLKQLLRLCAVPLDGDMADRAE